MRKIFLFCDAGMSTSLLVSKMRKVAEEHEVPVTIEAHSFAKFFEVANNESPDCILLGPQVKYLLKDIEGICQEKNIPVDVIDSVDYGTMNGEKVLKKAIKMIKQNKNK